MAGENLLPTANDSQFQATRTRYELKVVFRLGTRVPRRDKAEIGGQSVSPDGRYYAQFMGVPLNQQPHFINPSLIDSRVGQMVLSPWKFVLRCLQVLMAHSLLPALINPSTNEGTKRVPPRDFVFDYVAVGWAHGPVV